MFSAILHVKTQPVILLCACYNPILLYYPFYWQEAAFKTPGAAPWSLLGSCGSVCSFINQSAPCPIVSTDRDRHRPLAEFMLKSELERDVLLLVMSLAAKG